MRAPRSDGRRSAVGTALALLYFGPWAAELDHGGLAEVVPQQKGLSEERLRRARTIGPSHRVQPPGRQQPLRALQRLRGSARSSVGRVLKLLETVTRREAETTAAVLAGVARDAAGGWAALSG
ncbi:unnamed protein product, partial [Polarella glacialis]